MKFYDCATAPSPRRVRMFLADKGLTLDTVQVDLAGGEQLSDAFKRVNPDCTVPVLELDDGTRLTEVFAICQYLEETAPEPVLLGRDAKERALVTMWNTKIEGNGFLAVAETFRNRAKGLMRRALTGPDDYDQIPALIERGEKRFRAFAARLDRELEGQEFIVGEQFSIADITAYVVMEFAARCKMPIGDELRHLRRWHQQVAKRPSAEA